MSVKHSIQPTLDDEIQVTLTITVRSQKDWNNDLRAGILRLDQIRETWLLENHLVSMTGGHPTLTPRENQVFALLLEGKPNKEIAHALTISANTVESHVQHIHHKLHTRSRVELMREYGKVGK